METIHITLAISITNPLLSQIINKPTPTWRFDRIERNELADIGPATACYLQNRNILGQDA